jgi:MinD superfamily P-loop ATPase
MRSLGFPSKVSESSPPFPPINPIASLTGFVFHRPDRSVEDLSVSGILTLNEEACAECGLCVAVCGYEALILHARQLEIIEQNCVLCDVCVIACPTDALMIE